MNAIRRMTPIATAVGALGLAMTGTAFAAPTAYSVAYNDITNLLITGAGPGTSLEFSLPSSVNSAATACLPNGNCVNTGGAGVTDALPAQIGVNLGNNAYLPPVGENFANSYSRGDASIDSQQTGGAAFTQARNLAEGLLLENNTANANAGNSSGTTFTSTFEVNGPAAQLRFQFDADPFMRALLIDAVPLSQADATIAVSFNITNNFGQTVFSWAPDGNTSPGGLGQIGGTIGGVEIADAFSINNTLVALPGNPGPLVYDPLNCAPSAAGYCFEALTNTLTAGTYTLNLSMSERTNQQLTARVPEPNTLGLLGVALLGFALRDRRAKK